MDGEKAWTQKKKKTITTLLDLNIVQREKKTSVLYSTMLLFFLLE